MNDEVTSNPSPDDAVSQEELTLTAPEPEEEATEDEEESDDDETEDATDEPEQPEQKTTIVL